MRSAWLLLGPFLAGQSPAPKDNSVLEQAARDNWPVLLLEINMRDQQATPYSTLALKADP